MQLKTAFSTGEKFVFQLKTAFSTSEKCPMINEHKKILDDFKTKTIKHPIIEELRKTLYAQINNPVDASIIVVYGPTGVGKTTLIKILLESLFADAMSEMEEDPGYVPYVLVDAIAHGSGYFNWRDFYMRTLNSLDEVLIERKIIYSQDQYPNRAPIISGNKRVTEADLRFALEQCLLNRRVKALLIDEAQHLYKLKRGSRRLDQMDAIKSLAEKSKAIHVLVGTYELLEMIQFNAQLIRRRIRLHFPRYRADDENDRAAFLHIVLSFQDYLSKILGTPQDFASHFSYIYVHSLGCVGLLKSWLVRALWAALEDGKTQITINHLKKTELSEYDLLRMGFDIQQSEELIKAKEGQLEELYGYLGIQPHQNNTPQKRNSKPKKVNSKPGKRKAERDPVDTTQNERQAITNL